MDWATYVIQGDPDRPTKVRLRTQEGSPPGDVALLRFANNRAEAAGIASLIERLVESIPLERRLEPEEILVLLRADYLGSFSKPIKEKLDELQIPYSDSNAIRQMLSESKNRLIIGIFRILVNREDSLAWASILHLTRGVGQSFSEYVYKRAKEAHTQFGTQLLTDREEGFPGAPRAPANRAIVIINQVIQWLNSRSIPDELPGNGWGNWMVSLCHGEELLCPTNDFRQLLLDLDEIVEPGIKLERYLGQINPLGKDYTLAQSKGVRIMSMAESKGLTVRATIIGAAEEGIIPRPAADLGEERRLLYVAMTRAKEYLYCTWAQRRQGPTARAGQPKVQAMRQHSSYFDAGPVESQDGLNFIDHLRSARH